MIVVDTSAWIEFLRATESSTHHVVRRLLVEREELAVTEVVVMEVLAGARSPRQVHDLRATLLAFPVLPLGGLAGYEAAAQLYRACRRAGETVRRLVDCLVAVPVIEAGASLLHADEDFDRIARHAPLRIHPGR